MPTIPPIETIEHSGKVYIAASAIVGRAVIFLAPSEKVSGRIHLRSNESFRISAQGIINVEEVTQRYFRDNIQRFLPSEYWRQDSKSVAEGGGEGALDHLTQVFALSLDEIKQAIDRFVELFDIDHCPPRYLYTIARLLNYPLSERDGVSTQRKQLREAIEWYRFKGARKSFESMLYAFGFNATVVPLWTEDYEVFTENLPEVTKVEGVYTNTVPGVAAGNAVPNDYPLLIENGGTWYRSPHFGIYLKSIIGDNILSLNWDSWDSSEETGDPDLKDEFEARVAAMGYFRALFEPVDQEVAVKTVPGGYPSGSGELDTYVLTSGGTFKEVVFTITRNEKEVFLYHKNTDINDEDLVDSSDVVFGSIQVHTGEWVLTFSNPSDEPDPGTSILAKYTTPYSMLDKLVSFGVSLQHIFEEGDFSYVWQRIEYIRPVFEVLDWLGFMLDIEEYYSGPTPVFDFVVNPVLEDRGWYLGYCDLNDAIYTRLDPRLLGNDYLSITSPLGASTAATETSEIAYSVISPTTTYATGTLSNAWLYQGAYFEFKRGGDTITVVSEEGSAGLNVLGSRGSVVYDGFENSGSGNWSEPTPIETHDDGWDFPYSGIQHWKQTPNGVTSPWTTQSLMRNDDMVDTADVTIASHTRFIHGSQANVDYWADTCIFLRGFDNGGYYNGYAIGYYSKHRKATTPVNYFIDIKIYKITGNSVFEEIGSYTTPYRAKYDDDYRWMNLKVSAEGDSLRCKLWDASQLGESEPADWTYEITDSTFSNDGYIGRICKGNRPTDAGYSPTHIQWNWFDVGSNNSTYVDDTTYGYINYLTGFWEILFEGVPPDDATDITAFYSYATDIPPVDRSDALPRGATKLPFPLLRNPKEGYCYAPEELWLDIEHSHDDPYMLPLTRDGLNLYNDWSPGDYIDRADFPSRGFTDLSGTNHANTLTRATGESDRVLSVLGVGVEPIAAFTYEVEYLTVDFTDTTDTNMNIISWHWDFGDGEDSWEQNPSHLYATDDTFTVVLTVVNAVGTDDDSQDVTTTP